ncbi:MAG: SMC-Scp complex subunit ScpB [Candidatus Latescibacteria bacterium]|nr:SMC-Scp complex subunit ScpB [Candidatus Latescibacterota bacterium]NIM21334.1 SMC-Scp complex subunit ScpB [Candidatus Latescibacterota bacterium]NIM65515.1 SMC-Scp complex subunit ScpB [Candidatus Latescibacterota bacterium]NIO01895.1 SMC-Scp complex subunit ScpB [Candidatus Latescibacterota bacterium]NIO28708.1 SMC-Scp complex subunit ScpB [Candidatus Latescibacterota bacterium]
MFDHAELDRVVLALLFASDEPLEIKRIAQLIETPRPAVKDSIDRLAERLNTEEFSIMLEKVALGYQLSTRPEFSKFIARLYSGKRKQRLSKAGLETLAIIAYKQPITRAEIENIRGVSCGGVITTLMERSLIRIVGKAKVLGAPFLYGTTQEFLEYLGLNSLKDLPTLEELEALLEQEEYKEEGAEPDQLESAEPTRQAEGAIESSHEHASPEELEDELKRPGEAMAGEGGEALDTTDDI